FDGIIPCGIQDHGVTSMEAILGNTIPLTDLIPHLSDAFSTVLGVEKVDSLLVDGG
ncbi:MAG: lipoyl(octanoyl) transferase, partial [Chloroflexi bacterium]|nr:lipoyl(octanoyl) transferase [Chloroflexota bacterium]